MDHNGWRGDLNHSFRKGALRTLVSKCSFWMCRKVACQLEEGPTLDLYPETRSFNEVIHTA